MLPTGRSMSRARFLDPGADPRKGGAVLVE
jgi:hypothetical protein